MGAGRSKTLGGRAKIVDIFHVENKTQKKSEQPVKNTIITNKTMTLNKTEDAKYTSICV